MRKRIIALSLTMAMCFSLSVTAFAESPIEQARAWASEAGLSEEFLDCAYDNLIIQIYNDNKSASTIEFEATVKHGAEALNPNMRLVDIPADELDLWCVAAKVSSATGYVEYVNIYVYYVWDVDFGERELLYIQDAVGLTWDSSVWTRTTNSIFRTELAGARYDYVYHTSARPATSAQGGVGWGLPIESAQGAPYGSARIQLFPVDTQMVNGTRYNTSFDAVYGHTTIDETAVEVSFSGIAVTFEYATHSASSTCSTKYGV